ncbi:capsule polysaccharide biosynthesis protein [Elsinoe ampelina]|uniref:Capsule polysaccharide biosynthesis protein n=1 Tax=Elsinoe ampelina TaxID=302913 RepID=A0A6A6G0I1_9PEZI|nr:capsule polysaccharide biosynthesis protein [Elsinoe ampelina]
MPRARPAEQVATLAVPAAIISALGYGAYRTRLLALLSQYLSQPGRKSRVFALLLLIVNWKSLPFAWTFRVWYTMVTHILLRKPPSYPPSSLFSPVVTSSHVSLFETDYNLHKSNSTYFADLDVSRSHLVSHITARGIKLLNRNATTRLVMDPTSPNKPAKGRFGVFLGAVQCTFHREIGPFQRYEMWSRILAWDRKWLYMVTHFVEKGASKAGKKVVLETQGAGKAKGTDAAKVYGTAVSKYVFKMGRLTVHPAILLDASDLLPAREGGWVVGEEGVVESENLGEVSEQEAGQWSWRQTEQKRREGMKFAAHFAALEGLSKFFDVDADAVLGNFAVG